MMVKIYDIEDGGAEVLRCEALLADAIERDDPEYRQALAELERAGRYWAGGGAAPFVLLMRVQP